MSHLRVTATSTKGGVAKEEMMVKGMTTGGSYFRDCVPATVLSAFLAHLDLTTPLYRATIIIW